ncbi:MAG TPA: FHA domain-containing protein [Stellaceae bacterium]|jgi:hypothetical protein
MAEVIWVELLSRHGPVSARFRCTGPEIRIGRSYHNDVVIDDAAVAPEHLRITRAADGAIVAEALDAQSFALAGERRDRSLIDGDSVLRIGHTLVRVRDADYPVPAEAPARRPTSWVAVSALIVAALAINGMMLWLDETTEPKATRYIGSIAELAAAALAWAALWAVFSRIFSGQARFSRNLTIGVSGILAYSLYRMLTSGLAFSLSSQAVANYAFGGIWLLLAIVCFLHLHGISPTRPLLKAAILGGLAAGVIGLQLANAFDLANPARQQPIYARTLLPPAFRLARVKSEDGFFAEINSLKAKLDSDRVAAASAP